MEPCQRPRSASFIHVELSRVARSSTGSRVGSSRSPSQGKPLTPNANTSSKRRTEIVQSKIIVENVLIRLCRAKDWRSVVQRCSSHPEEAIPMEMVDNHHENRYNPHAAKRIVKEHNLNSMEDCILYHETALGIACASQHLRSDLLQEVVKSLLHACPRQIRCSQLLYGHTPLRDAVCNPHCNTNILQMLLKADEINGNDEADTVMAVRIKDQSGLLPVDHLILGVQLGSTAHSVDMLKEYFKLVSLGKTQNYLNHSPLIRLLTMGSSLDRRTLQGSHRCERESHDSPLEQILEITKFLLEHEPKILHERSKLTGCTPLHVALRNFGNFTPLISLMISKEESTTLMRTRNNFGDLPLHVACSVGVPFEVLQVIVACTIACEEDSSYEPNSPVTNPLIWSVNKSGYTPVDLEWVRHIEGGQGLYTGRSFYPLEPSGVMKHCFKQDEYYQAILCEAVDKAIATEKDALEQNFSASERREKARATFGSLLERISFLISACSSKSPCLTSSKFLHAVCRLTTIDGPSLPGPLLKLFLWIHRCQLMTKDHSGMLPIHYLLSQAAVPSDGEAISNPVVWKEFVLKFLAEAPECIQVPNAYGRLPIHILLDHSRSRFDAIEKKIQVQAARHGVLKELVRLYPESVDRLDPSTRMYPFLLAAKDDESTLDTIYFLLRHSPSRCSDQRLTK